MDVITLAIVGALAGISKDAIKDSYDAFKAVLKKKFGEKSDLAEAVTKLEEKPNSEGRKATVQEEVEAAKANDDSELRQLAQDLLSKLREQPGGQQVINQTISNVKYAATTGTGNANISNITDQGATQDS